MTPDVREKLRASVRFLYDIQAIRIATAQRSAARKGEVSSIILDDKDKAFIETMGKGLKALERQALKEVVRYGEHVPVWAWLRDQRGVGPMIAGFLVSEFDVRRAERPSQFWSYAGLSVEHDLCFHCAGTGFVENAETEDSDECVQCRGSGRGGPGYAPRPRKGEKLRWNRWLRTKCVFVLGGALLKTNNEKYREQYDHYKHRKESQVGPCCLCGGTGNAVQPKTRPDGRVSPSAGKKVQCWNCVGDKVDGRLSRRFTPDRAPWGRGAKHRHQAATRYMVKMFLADFWREWRTQEGLPVVPTYHEAVLGHTHHVGGKGVQTQAL